MREAMSGQGASLHFPSLKGNAGYDWLDAWPDSGIRPCPARHSLHFPSLKGNAGYDWLDAWPDGGIPPCPARNSLHFPSLKGNAGCDWLDAWPDSGIQPCRARHSLHFPSPPSLKGNAGYDWLDAWPDCSGKPREFPFTSGRQRGREFEAYMHWRVARGAGRAKLERGKTALQECTFSRGAAQCHSIAVAKNHKTAQSLWRKTALVLETGEAPPRLPPGPPRYFAKISPPRLPPGPPGTLRKFRRHASPLAPQVLCENFATTPPPWPPRYFAKISPPRLSPGPRTRKKKHSARISPTKRSPRPPKNSLLRPSTGRRTGPDRTDAGPELKPASPVTS